MYRFARYNSASAHLFHAAGIPAVAMVLLCAASVYAQEPLLPFEDCTVHVLNQTIHVSKDGGWQIPNVPTNGGLVRARLHCNSPFGVRQGQSDFFVVQPNVTNTLKSILITPLEPGPTRLSLAVETEVLKEVNQAVQVTVTGHYGEQDTKDLALGTFGTNYNSSNPEVVSVSPNGLLTAHKSGTVMIVVWNEGITSTLRIRVEIGDDSDGDGLPDDYETEVGLDPNDPVDALVDHDADNLTALQEYAAGTNPFSADSDGDSIADGEEVEPGKDGFVTSPTLKDTDGDLISDNVELLADTDPTDGTHFNLSKSLLGLEVSPEQVVLHFNTLIGEASALLEVMGVQLDGTGIYLTAHSQTSYKSKKPSIANLGLIPGQIFAGQVGTTTVEVSVGSWNAEVPVNVFTFEPKPLAVVKLQSCTGRKVHFFEGNVFVACATQGLRAVSLADFSAPLVVAKVSDFQAWNLAGSPSGLLWVATNGEALLGLDTSDLATPKVVQEIPVPKVYSVDSNGSLLLAGASTGGVTVIDTSTAPPTILGTVNTPGVNDLSSDGTLAAIVFSNKQLGVVDLSTPEQPKLTYTGSPGVALFKIDLRGKLAAAAIGNSGMALIDLSDSGVPKKVSQMGPGLFMLNDVSLRNNLAFGADYYRVNEVPIINTALPESPFFAGQIDFSKYKDSNGLSIDTTAELVALTTTDQRLYVGQYQKLADNNNIAPVCTVIEPAESAQVAAGAQITVTISAIDDVVVEFVETQVNDEKIATDLNAPYSTKVVLPDTPGEIVMLGALAVDSAGNVGTCYSVALTLIEDPLNTVMGFVVDEEQNPLEGVLVEIFESGKSTLSDAAGAFSIEGIATVKPFYMVATVEKDGSVLAVSKGPFAPNPYEGQDTDVGTLVLTATPPPLYMGPVVSQTVTFESVPNAYPSGEVTTMGPVVSQTVTFDSSPNAYPSGEVTTMGPVVSQTVTFEAAEACNPSPCLNGGICVADTPAEFECKCTSGWAGEVCGTSYPKDCAEILSADPNSEDGEYQIAPEGVLLTAKCNTNQAAGGWTLLSQAYLDTLQPGAFNYLYSTQLGWIKSPATSLIWNWTLYTPLEGLWSYSGETTAGDFNCNDIETGLFGVGCSNGPFNAPYKCIAHGNGGQGQQNPEIGTATICEHQPGVLGEAPCVDDVQIWIRRIDNPCESTCQNDGSCVDLGGGEFGCQCMSGWTGPTCETEVINPCDSSPCLNNGECQLSDGPPGELAFQCWCPPEWTGDTCDEPVVACNNNGFCEEFNEQELPGENCANCPGDCGSCCCLIGGGIWQEVATWSQGCGDPQIEVCVCSDEDFLFCCDGGQQGIWAPECVFAAQFLCGLQCEEDGGFPGE
jgi:hypothetical protein